MSREDVEERIRDAMSEPTEITAEDLSPPVCCWCGEELIGDVQVVTWEMPEQGNEDIIYRYRYCSKHCLKSDKEALMGDEAAHPHGEPLRLHKDEKDVMTDGGEVNPDSESGIASSDTVQLLKEIYTDPVIWALLVVSLFAGVQTSRLEVVWFCAAVTTGPYLWWKL